MPISWLCRRVAVLAASPCFAFAFLLTAMTAPAQVRPGAEVLFDDPTSLSLIRGKRIGLVTNPTGVDRKLRSTIDRIHALSKTDPKTTLTALYAPEHGLRGAQGAGEAVSNSRDPATSVPIYSLHGTGPDGKPLHKPTTASLAKVDVLLYDIQDIGNRSYTYVGTMEKCMEAAAERKIPFVVLDRPNPMGGNLVDGPLLDPALQSLVGWAPVPYLYGMTPGEMARWMNDNSLTTRGKQIAIPIACDLHVVPLHGWRRDMLFWETGLPWIPTSTHMPRPEACWHIATTGALGELRSLSEGVGYPAPFEYVGAPFINGDTLAEELNRRALPGYVFRPVQYRPYYASFEGEQCGGVHVMITDYRAARPLDAAIHLLDAIHRLYPDEDILRGVSKRKAEVSRVKMFDKVIGFASIRTDLLNGRPPAEILESWKAPREAWIQNSRKYLLYN